MDLCDFRPAGNLVPPGDPGPLPRRVPFRYRLTVAIQDGLLWGVKLALALGLVVVAISYLLGDYSQTRQRALNGQQAFEFLQRQLAAQTPAPVAPTAPKPSQE